MKYRLKTKLTLSYLLVAFLSLFLISVITNVLLEKSFRNYVTENQEKQYLGIVNSLSKQYENHQTWHLDVIEIIGTSALENGLIIKLEDKNGLVIWDAHTHNNSMCQSIIKEMATNISKSVTFLNPEYKEIPYDIFNGSVKVGTVKIGTYGPFYYDTNDLSFIDSLNKVLLIVGSFSLIFSIFLGAIMAKKISTPLSKAVKSAHLIAEGYYTDRIQQKSNTIEIDQLIKTINHLAQSLEQQDGLRKRLTSDVSHELRTPLATLKSHLEAMIDGIWEPSVVRLTSCQDEITRLNKMVGDLEQLTKYESESVKLHKTEFDLSNLVQRVVQNFEGELFIKKQTIKLDTQQTILLADQDKIIQVVINLLSNAIKYTPEGGHIEIHLEAEQKYAHLQVKDNGIGISQEDQALVFERFYRTDQSRTRMTGGSGIGLTIVKAIVDAHQGKIELKSTLEMGSEFHVFLPIHP